MLLLRDVARLCNRVLGHAPRVAEQSADHWQLKRSTARIRCQRVPQIVSKSSRGPAANRTHD
jgi:hypothetical protein